MKILFIVGFYFEIGGPFFALKTLLSKISDKGINVSVISPIPQKYNNEKLNFIRELSFKVVYVQETLSRKIMPSFSKNFIRIIKKEAVDCDLIHLNGVFDYYSIVTSFLSKPYVLSLRGSLMKEAYKLTKFKAFKKDIFKKLFGDRIINKAGLIHVMCKEELHHFLYFYPNSKKKVRVIPNSLELSQFQKLPAKGKFIEKYPILKDKKYILFLSRINAKKGLDLLIKAFSMILKEKDLYLVIAGEDDADGYKTKVKEWIKGYGLGDRVIFSGMLRGVNKLSAFVDAEIFILSSYSENFGMAVIEAMACGTPIVISDKVGISREIEENNAGIVVKTNPESIYAGIKNLLDNYDLKKQIAENGKKMVKKYYDVNKVADKMIKMYEETLLAMK